MIKRLIVTKRAVQHTQKYGLSVYVQGPSDEGDYTLMGDGILRDYPIAKAPDASRLRDLAHDSGLRLIRK